MTVQWYSGCFWGSRDILQKIIDIVSQHHLGTHYCIYNQQ